MKKILAYSVCTMMLLSGCASNAGQGAYVGAQFGSIIGSAIGGISGGQRGSDMGTLIGMAGGAVVGAAIGNAQDKSQQNEYEQHRQRATQGNRRTTRSSGNADDMYGYNNSDRQLYSDQRTVSTQQDNSGFDPTNSGDDRITMEDSSAPTENATPNRHVINTTVPAKTVSVDQLAQVAPGYQIKFNPMIELRNASFVDASGDGIISAGETCQVVFEIMNHSPQTIYNVLPTVIETTGNKHIYISPSIRVESIAPERGVRYTATVTADNRLKDGLISIKVAVAQESNNITSQVKEFNIVTRRK